MAHVVTDACVKCKYTTCVDVCPVNCFHEGDVMLAIDPKTCIDCGVCVAECPVNAIKSDADAELKWIERNAKLSKIWPRITATKEPLKDAQKHVEEKDKFEKYCKELAEE